MTPNQQARLLRDYNLLVQEANALERQRDRWKASARAAQVTVRKIRRMLASVDRRLMNGKQRDR